MRLDAAAAAHDLRALLAPGGGQLRVLLAADALVGGPAGLGVVAEVRVDAERQVGEVAQPGEHPVHVVRRDAVDEQGAHAHLLEAAGGAPEQVPLGAAPVLPEDTAEAVTAAAEAEPHGQPGGERGLDGGEGLVADQGHRLEQEQVGRLLLEGAREQLEALEPLGAVHVAVEAERDRAVVRAPELGGGVAGEPDPAAGQLHPVGGRRAGRPALAVHRLLDAPGVRRDHVAADLGVRAVHAGHRARRVEQRPRAPEGLVALVGPRDLELPQLGRDPAVEDHALVTGQELLDAAVGGRAAHARRRGHQSRVTCSSLSPGKLQTKQYR